MIAVLMGGNSAERAVSLRSGTAVFNALKRQQIACFAFDWQADNLAELWQKKFDCAFIMLHGRGGEDGFIQAELDARGIKYTGSGARSSQNSMNKATTKSRWVAHNLPVSPSIIAHKNRAIAAIDFPLPWAVKPACEGSSIGISKVKTRDELGAALALAWRYDDQVLVEQWIEGGEYTVAILGGVALPAIQIKVAQNFYDFDAKYQSNSTEYLCPCGLNSRQESALQQLALRAFHAMDARGWGRIDFMLNADNQPYLLEINTVPGMTEQSLVPMAAAQAGLDFEALVRAIVDEIPPK